MKSKRNTAKEFLDNVLKGRPMPTAPRAGVKKSKSRYDNGGKVSRKKDL